MIPEAAVEAGARHLGFYTDCPDNDWTVEARALLEAAAPHILAEVWEEGFDYARNYSWTPESNPYRPTP